MPPKFKFNKEKIIDVAYNLIDEKGLDALTARALGAKLNSSSKVIFGLFKNMDDLKNNVIIYGYQKFGKLMEKSLKTGDKPKYLTCGLAYINIAKTHPNIFKFLFMRDTRNEDIVNDNYAKEIIAEFISKKSNISLEDAIQVHDKYWFVMHGIATSIATSYINFDDDYIESVLKENYESLIRNVKEGGKINDFRS